MELKKQLNKKLVCSIKILTGKVQALITLPTESDPFDIYCCPCLPFPRMQYNHS